MLMPAETVGTFPTEPADGIAGSNVTVSGGQAQNVSTSIFIMISGSYTGICQEFTWNKIVIKECKF